MNDIDLQTRSLYDQVRGSPEHGPFIRQIEALAAADEPLPQLNATVVIVPGAFHEDFPQSGADGHLVRKYALQSGCRVESIPLPNLGSLAQNARQIVDWLNQRNGSPVILASVSKGGSDIKCALTLPDAARAFRNVIAWINLSGILDGTPLIAWLSSNSLRSHWTRFLLRGRGYDLKLIRELDHRAGAPLDFELHLPKHLQAIHVVGFPLREHASNHLARRNYERLEPYGPNDGAGILLADTVNWPGLLYPVWSADHYLRPKECDMGRIMTALLQFAAQRQLEPV